MLNRKKYVSTVFIALFLISSLGLISCSKPPDSDLGEYKIPNTYTTYTDKNGLFSISYPSDWTTLLSRGPQSLIDQFRYESDSLYEYWNHKDSSKIPHSKDGWGSWQLFIAEKTNPNSGYLVLNVIVLLNGEGTKEQFYNKALETTNYKAYLKETLRIDGKEVVIFILPNGLVISAVIVNQTCWVTACGVSDSQNEKDAQIIVRSLRILK